MPLYALTLLVTASPDEVEPVAERQRARIRELHAGGKLRLAGELAQGDGFLEILDVADRLEAESLARSSPLAEAGLASWMLRELVDIV